MTTSKPENYYFRWIQHVLIPLVCAAAIPVGATIFAKIKEGGPELPISGNPSVAIAGDWKVVYWETATYSPRRGKTPVATSVVTPRDSFVAQIQLKKKPGRSRFYGTAKSGSRIWALEGYADGNSVIYVYKDSANANSFGSAVIRLSSDAGVLTGVWAGVSPNAPGKQGPQTPPFLTGGTVRWTHDQ